VASTSTSAPVTRAAASASTAASFFMTSMIMTLCSHRLMGSRVRRFSKILCSGLVCAGKGLRVG
jgi:hypothetical protein